jgi:hypothetical protein
LFVDGRTSIVVCDWRDALIELDPFIDGGDIVDLVPVCIQFDVLEGLWKARVEGASKVKRGEAIWTPFEGEGSLLMGMFGEPSRESPRVNFAGFLLDLRYVSML